MTELAKTLIELLFAILSALVIIALAVIVANGR
jgi:hypothetical protein